MRFRARQLCTSLLVLHVVTAPARAQLAPAEPGASLFQRVDSLQKDGKFEAATALLVSHLDSEPNDVKARYALGLVALRVRDLAQAKSAEQRLATAGAAGTPYATRLHTFVIRAEEKLAAEDRLVTHLTSLDAKGAVDSVRLIQGDDNERALLLARLRIYQGQFAGAASAVLPMQAAPETAELASTFIREARSAGTQFSERFNRLNWFLSSPLALSPCTPDGARAASVAANFNLAEYVQLASSTFIDYPLNDWAMDIAFHAALISSPYEQVERFGDAILKGRGVLRLPFISRAKRYWVVVDARAGRLRTEESAQSTNPLGSEEWTEYVPFDLPLRDVRGLRQAASSDAVGGFLKKDAYALKLEPNGLAPYYAFMPLVHCLYGEVAQKQITANLGRYLLHVIGTPAPRAQLADPTHTASDWLGKFSGIMAWSTTMTGLSATAVSGVGPASPSADFASALQQAAQMQNRVKEAGANGAAIRAAQRRSSELFATATTQSVARLLERLESEQTSKELVALLSGVAR